MCAITDNEKQQLLEDMLEEAVSWDCLADEDNDYCGQICLDELVSIAKDGINDVKKDDKFLATLGFDINFLKNIEFSDVMLRNTCEDLAYQTGVRIL